MISRRSKPVKVESPAMQGAAASGEGEGSSVFFCLAATSRGKKEKNMSYFCSNASGEDAEAARALATLCLNHAPEHHVWHHHTIGGGRRTFAFLAADDGRTYLAIVDPTPGSAETVQFLERVRDACSSAEPSRRPRDDPVADVVRQFVQALHAAAGTTIPGTSSSTTGDVVLLGDPPSALAHADDKDEEEARPDQEGARRPRQVSWVRTWWRRYAGVVIGVDVLLCLVLFGVWMAVCRGFGCVQR